MSYCRWSSENGYCDVYVYESVYGGWVTHVASLRRPPGRPVGYMEETYRQISAGGSTDHEAAKKRGDEQRAWDETHPLEPIGIDGFEESYCHDSPGECADNLEAMKAAGFMVPQYAIDALREEQDEMEAGQ